MLIMKSSCKCDYSRLSGSYICVSYLYTSKIPPLPEITAKTGHLLVGQISPPPPAPLFFNNSASTIDNPKIKPGGWRGDLLICSRQLKSSLLETGAKISYEYRILPFSMFYSLEILVSNEYDFWPGWGLWDLIYGINLTLRSKTPPHKAVPPFISYIHKCYQKYYIKDTRNIHIRWMLIEVKKWWMTKIKQYAFREKDNELFSKYFPFPLVHLSTPLLLFWIGLTLPN